MAGTITAMQAAADKLAGWSLGYDQGDRWNIKDGGECDCSSSSGWIAKQGGYPIVLTGTFYTGNFAARAKAAGFAVLKFTNLSAVKPGDFLVTPGHHVVFVRDSKRWFSAENDERGRSSGGKGGDQTGHETRYRAPYVRPGGWTYIVRPPATIAPTKPVVVVPVKPLTFRLATFNVLGRRFDYGKTWATRLPRIVARLRRVLDDTAAGGASVVCLTECRAQEAAEIAKALGMRYVSCLGSSILYSSTWKLGAHSGKVWLGSTHGAVIAELSRAGHTVNIVCNHMPPFVTRNSRRKEIARSLTATVKGWHDPTILAGDFNDRGPVRDLLTGAGWTNAATRAVIKIRANYRTNSTFKVGTAIDYVFGKGVSFQSLRTLRGWDPATKKTATDHHMLTAQITLN